MTGYFIRRIISLFFVMLVVSAIVFVLMNSIPGGPFSLGERGYSADALANLERKYGLDKPLAERYLNFLIGAVRLDFGNSFAVAGNPPVTQVILRTWPITLHVGVLTIGLSFTLGILMGIVSAYRRNSFLDNAVTFTATLGITLPNFIIATFLLLIFGYQNGWGTPNQWIIGPLWEGGPALLSRDYFLPVITYALAPLALVARYTRSSVSDALGADYVRTARSKGLTDRAVMFRHVLRNALIPIITSAGSYLPYVFLGSLVFESFFGLPGLGAYVIEAITKQDFAVVRTMVFLGSLLYILSYIVIDVAYTWADPRVRLA